jgi:hypothetical protein
MDSRYGGQQSVFGWWNETRGKTVGVKLNVKAHDMRYDASRVPRSWPRIVADDKPIVVLGMGTPDLVSPFSYLQGCLPEKRPCASVRSARRALPAMLLRSSVSSSWRRPTRPIRRRQFAVG